MEKMATGEIAEIQDVYIELNFIKKYRVFL
jgi:hypothetical protein